MRGRLPSLIGRQIVGGKQRRMVHAIRLLTVWISLITISTVCVANQPADEQLYDIDIPSLNAAMALNRLAEQTGAIMLFPFDLAETHQANAVRGSYTLMDALGELLRNSGLSSSLSNKRVIQIALAEPIERKMEEREMTITKVPFRRKVGTFFASLLIASGAGAQDAAENEEAEDSLEEIIVTGSRIPRNSFNLSTPLVSIGSEEITDAGLSSLAEILIDEMPSLYESSSNTNSQSQIGNTGVTSANLRRLGSNRTLILIDGRRIVTNAYGSKTVSLNTIPSGMVNRVEVVTGGSSATYGSDAIAGVVNIITEQDKEGFGFETRYGLTTEGGGEEFTIDLDYGTTFADGRGYLFLAGSYYDEGGIDNIDRERAQLEADFDYNTTLLCNEMQTETGDQCMRDITPADWRDRSDGTFGGVFSERSGYGNWWYDENNVLQTGWSEERDGLFSRQWDVVKIPNDQIAVALKVDYELSEKTKAYFQLQYSRNESFNFKSMEDQGENQLVATIDRVTGAPDQISPGHMSSTNPFIPDQIRNDPNFATLWNGDWDRRYAEVGNITTDNERTTWRTWAGLQGSIFDDAWDWDLSVGYGNFEQYQVRSNEIDVVKEGQALDAELAPDGVTIQCADPAARAAGCVPLNLFGAGSITPEMADWIRVNPIINPTVELLNVLGYMTGDLFEMPAGTVGAVFGFEWRRDSMNLRVSDGPRYGGITFNLVPPIKGDFDVAEVFTEMSFPLADRLTADISLRAADYSMKNISTVFSHTAGLIWEPADGYIIRTNFARAQRAPDITELLSPRRGDYDSFDDICADVSATSTGQGHDNCRLEPAIAAAIAADPTFVFDDENNGYGPAIGNEDLFEETADTFTIGFSIAPSFLEGFRLAVDYYDITIDDAIIEMENSEIMKQCYASSVPFGQANVFCDDITRDDEGQMVEILNRQLNLNEQSTSGYDVALDYVFETDSIGEIQLVTHYTHINKHESKFDGVDGVETVDFNNQLDFGVFEDVATASIAWRYNDWRVRWRTTWKGPIIDHKDRIYGEDGYLELFADNDALCASADPTGCITNPEVPAYLFYPSYIRHDLSASYDMTLESGSTLNVYGGIRNMFDKDIFVPRTGDAYEGGIGNYDSKFGGGIGRYVYVGVQMRFDD
jgi:iron complex outermembrane recepter protein